MDRLVSRADARLPSAGYARKVGLASFLVLTSIITTSVIYRNRAANLENQFATSRHLLELVSKRNDDLKRLQPVDDNSDGTRFLEDFKTTRWGKALQLVANNLGTSATTAFDSNSDVLVRPRLPSGVQGIALVNVRFAEGKDLPRNFEMFLKGISTDVNPRSNADAFRQGLDASFTRTFRPRAPLEYLNLEDLPDQGRTRRAGFDLAMTAEFPEEKP